MAFGPAADVAGFLAADVVATVLFRGEMQTIAGFQTITSFFFAIAIWNSGS